MDSDLGRHGIGEPQLVRGCNPVGKEPGFVAAGDRIDHGAVFGLLGLPVSELFLLSSQRRDGGIDPCRKWEKVFGLRIYRTHREFMLSAKLLTFAFDERLQHGLQGDLSFSRAGGAVFELDPAFVEAIQHTNSWCGVLHALRSE
jgi:hypothetical protein